MLKQEELWVNSAAHTAAAGEVLGSNIGLCFSENNMVISRWVANSVQSRGTKCRVFRKLLLVCAKCLMQLLLIRGVAGCNIESECRHRSSWFSSVPVW